jgi:hypothetical protein
VGRSGCCPNTGRAAAIACGETGCAARATGREAAIALAGTMVTAPRLTKLFTVTVRLIVVTWLEFTALTYRSDARYHGRYGSRGPSGTQPTERDAMAAPMAAPAARPKKVTSAGA